VNRQKVDEIRVIGRATQGVRIMALDEGDILVDVARLVPEEDGPDEEGDDVALEGGLVENGGPDAETEGGPDDTDASSYDAGGVDEGFEHDEGVDDGPATSEGEDEGDDRGDG
jgi:DNA gyrase subunit A